MSFAFVILTALAALLFAIMLSFFILRKKEGTQKAKELSVAIHHGALTFLNREYRILIPFVILVSFLLYFLSWKISFAFLVGAFFSALAGNIGVRIATKSNSRTAHACKESVQAGLKIAFSSGSVMALCVCGLGMLGVALLFMLFNDANVLFGFGFGASSIALFARLGGGIYTKIADMGADIVGKIEKGLAEDDPRNPAVIADQVGDNVGGIAGMGADLFESYVGSIIAVMAISFVLSTLKSYELPLMIAAFGIIASIIGYFFVKGRGYKALNKGVLAATAAMLLFTFLLMRKELNVFYVVASGLIAGLVIGFSTQHYTSIKSKAVRKVAESTKTGAATNLLSGFSTAMFSSAVPVIIVCIVILFSYYFAGLYGVALASVAMLSTLGVTLAIDCFGPVVDNAAGIAEMANLGARKKTEELDAIGNTTAAIGKGFAIGSAALTAIALFAVYSERAGVSINIVNPYVVSGIFIGALLPFLFSSLAIKAVAKGAFKMVEEVRRQFHFILKLRRKPDYNRCVRISTDSALVNMIAPSILAIASPIAIGFFLGKEALGGLLVGSIASGFLLAITLANSGCIWDNAKKYIEAGNLGGKGSETHKAIIISDTVGDPFKDTAGPSLNILIKLMAIVALLFSLI